MLNYNILKKNYLHFQKTLKNKNFFLDIQTLKKLEHNRKKYQILSEQLQNHRKKLSKYLIYYQNLYVNYNFIKNTLLFLKSESILIKKKLKNIQLKIYNFLIYIPNIPHIDTPIGKISKNNKEIYKWGKQKKFNFSIKDHVTLGQKLKGLDWNLSSVISGTGFVIMRGSIALLHRALGQFMLDIHTKMHGYIETYVPNLVNQKSVFGTGQLPKFENELFCTYFINKKKQKKYFLIPTSEVPLTNLIRDTIINEDLLPLKLTALSSCFRAENLAYGKNNRGLIRNYQFEKVEIIQIVKPQYSNTALDLLTQHAEKILKLLKLPYRKILLCTGELGFSAQKTYDLEVWFPSQNMYREISSCSLMGDFQTRRMNSRYYDNKMKKNVFLHTLNGSGLAVGRTLAAILENYQCSDGRIQIPKILQNPYMNGMTFLN
ncbi:serine--tRNA ligase [Buchnera aphidicola]|uniref:Serine--tRNA ligase n=1 Tax=Buchnera aphidicola subsp. Tuberolachnus salignus TaxID=98804 RepID=A0A160SWV0_BUCTT|nr:serine--tRNA ligase [Buchnera aphidicola]CUR53180.1 Serine--tRNA ligase [Buchnera aphidicola (Tuberolachnus salignus)]